MAEFDREDGIRRIQDQIISGVNAQRELEAMQCIVACLVDMMGGSITLHDYEYTKYFKNNEYTLETFRVLDPHGIQLKVVKRA